MNNWQYPFSHTSNDLLLSLDKENSGKALNYQVVAQSAEEVQAHSKCARHQYRALSDRVWANAAFECNQHLRSTRRSKSTGAAALYECHCTSHLESDG